VECRKFGTECTRNLIQLVDPRGADALDMYGHHLARMILQSNIALCQKARMRKQDLIREIGSFIAAVNGKIHSV
jgi:hypothetical protein